MKQIKIKQFITRVIIPLLVILLVIPHDLSAAEKYTRISVKKINGNVVEGVLVGVDLEEKSLVVGNEGTGIKCYITDIELIRYKQDNYGKRAAGKGFLIGGAIGIVGGIALNSRSEHVMGYSFGIGTVAITTLLAGGLGAIFGRIAGSGPHYKDLFMKDASPAQIEKHLKTLKRLALVNN